MKKRIGLDMRMAGEGFGIGKYVIELAQALLKRNSEFEYFLFFDKNFSRNVYENFQRIHANCELFDVPYYSSKEQISLPWLLNQRKLDLVHFPNFNAPIFYPGKFVLTIHDLIHHRYPGRKKKNLLYRWAYKLVINTAAWRANQIIAVSESSRNDIITLLGINPGKVSAVHSGLNPIFSPITDQVRLADVLKRFRITQKYILWVGVWRRYKNLPVLAQAFDAFQKMQKDKFQLVLVGEQDSNAPDIPRAVFSSNSKNDIIATGKISESDLVALYNGAFCYVTPSLSEGFNFPALEAQSCGAPVISSDIPVAREIFDSSVLYFNPNNPLDLAQQLQRLSADAELLKAIAATGFKNSVRYAWDKTAEATENIYRKALNIL